VPSLQLSHTLLDRHDTFHDLAITKLGVTKLYRYYAMRYLTAPLQYSTRLCSTKTEPLFHSLERIAELAKPAITPLEQSVVEAII
jgi:hypothetical protein